MINSVKIKGKRNNEDGILFKLHIYFMSAFGQDEPMTDKVAEASRTIIVAPEGYKLKPIVNTPDKEIEGYWESLFTQKRGESCAGNKIITYELEKKRIKEENGVVVGAGIRALFGRGEFTWIKNWGLFIFFRMIL